MENKTFLPIGTVVNIKKFPNKILIVGFNGVNKNKNITYDYIGFVYPQGFIDRKTTLLFNSDIIETVHYLGYKTAEHDEFNLLLNQSNASESEV